MSVAQRLRKLEEQEYERRFYVLAERIASKYGKDLDEILRLMREIERRVARWGIEGEHRRLALEYGMTDEEVERRYHEIVAEGL
jgi:hypothetical protein